MFFSGKRSVVCARSTQNGEPSSAVACVSPYGGGASCGRSSSCHLNPTIGSGFVCPEDTAAVDAEQAQHQDKDHDLYHHMLLLGQAPQNVDEAE